MANQGSVSPKFPPGNQWVDKGDWQSMGDPKIVALGGLHMDDFPVAMQMEILSHLPPAYRL